MLELRRICHKCMLFAMLAMGVTSCDSAIYDDEGDCSVHYRVAFRYTKNILGSDAFGPQVTGVHLYVFDKQGKLVASRDVDRQTSEDNNFFVDLDILPGKYDMLAWCEGKSPVADAAAFSVPEGAATTQMSDLHAVLPFRVVPRIYTPTATSTASTTESPPMSTSPTHTEPSRSIRSISPATLST